MSTSPSPCPKQTRTRDFLTSGTDLGNVMTSYTDTSSDKGMFENLGHGLGQLSDTRVHSSLESSRSVDMAPSSSGSNDWTSVKMSIPSYDVGVGNNWMNLQ